MAKKNFKGGLDSLIENSLGMKKKGKRGEMKGNPADLIKPEQTENTAVANVEEQNQTLPNTELENQTSEPAAPTNINNDSSNVATVDTNPTENDTETVSYLKNVITNLRQELFLWRNGKINVQTFNATLHTHGLKYNPTNNEIEEI